MIYDLDILVRFFLNINLVINAKKTKFIIFGPRNLKLIDIFSTLKVNEEEITPVKLRVPWIKNW